MEAATAGEFGGNCHKMPKMVDMDFFLSGGLDARGNAQVLSIGNITCQGKTF